MFANYVFLNWWKLQIDYFMQLLFFLFCEMKIETKCICNMPLVLFSVVKKMMFQFQDEVCGINWNPTGSLLASYPHDKAIKVTILYESGNCIFYKIFFLITWPQFSKMYNFDYFTYIPQKMRKLHSLCIYYLACVPWTPISLEN